MIIIDYNGIAVGNVITQRLDLQEDLIRHMILNTIRMYNVKFKDKYGPEVVIALEGGSWRKDYFPQYKANRKKSRDKDTMDWDKLYEIINKVTDEIKENFPYKVIKVDKAEADDIIGVLCAETQEFGKHDKVMIVSADKDFIQLQEGTTNISQYSPMTKKFISGSSPDYLFEHICKGDTSDGVPNILSADNFLVDGIRQKPMTKKKIALWLDDFNFMPSEIQRNYYRNRRLIDLSYVPKEIKDSIISSYENTQIASRSKILNYLIKHRCKMLMDVIQDF
jgi:hypothetical protein